MMAMKWRKMSEFMIRRETQVAEGLFGGAVNDALRSLVSRPAFLIPHATRNYD